MKKITMTLSSAEVALIDGRGSITASVNNASSAPERVVLGAFPGNGGPDGASAPTAPPASATPAATGVDAAPGVAGGTTSAGGAVPAAATGPASFASIDRPLRTIPPGATEQYEVKFDTTSASPGGYSVKLIPYSADEAPEDYAELGHVVTLNVAQPKKAEKKKFPWWIVIVAAVVLIGAGIAAFFLFGPKDPPAPTPTPTATQTPTPTPTPTPVVILELSGFSPSSGPLEGNIPITLTGRFVDPTTVSVGSTEVPATRVSDTEYTFTIPPGTQPGQVQLVVESAGERVGVAIFEYETPPTPPPGGDGPFLPLCVRNPEACFFVDENPVFELPDFDIPERRFVNPGDTFVPENEVRVPLEDLEFQR